MHLSRKLFELSLLSLWSVTAKCSSVNNVLTSVRNRFLTGLPRPSPYLTTTPFPQTAWLSLRSIHHCTIPRCIPNPRSCYPRGGWTRKEAPTPTHEITSSSEVAHINASAWNTPRPTLRWFWQMLLSCWIGNMRLHQIVRKSSE